MAVPVSDPVTESATWSGLRSGARCLARQGLCAVSDSDSSGSGAASSGGSVPSLGVVAFVSASASPDVGDSVFDESSVTLGRNGLRARESCLSPASPSPDPALGDD